jgi:hypothetical protein
MDEPAKILLSRPSHHAAVPITVAITVAITALLVRILILPPD